METFRGDETGLAVVAKRDDMQRMAEEADARLAGTDLDHYEQSTLAP